MFPSPLTQCDGVPGLSRYLADLLGGYTYGWFGQRGTGGCAKLLWHLHHKLAILLVDLHLWPNKKN